MENEAERVGYHSEHIESPTLQHEDNGRDIVFIYFADKSALDVLKIPYKIINTLIELRGFLEDEKECNVLIIQDDDILRTFINVTRYDSVAIVRGVGVIDAPKDGLIMPTGDMIEVIDDKTFFDTYRHLSDSRDKIPDANVANPVGDDIEEADEDLS